jgi:hypothetical protein
MNHSGATTDQDELKRLHETAKQNLERKLSNLSNRLFPLGKPTITDFYLDRTHKTYIEGIPDCYQLRYFFARYNELLAAHFSTRKDQNIYIHDANALWYYMTDRNHSFSRIYDQAKYNVLLAIIVSASPEMAQYCDPATKDFRESFLTAWLYATIRDKDTNPQQLFLQHWTTSKWDMVIFNDAQRSRIRKAIAQLKATVPPMPEATLRGFVTGEAAKLDTQQLRDYGPGWALQFLTLMDKDANAFENELREKLNAIAAERAGGMEQMMANANIDDDNVQLRPEFFHSQEVASILVPVDDSIIPEKKYTHPDLARHWIGATQGVDMLEGWVARLQNTTDMLSGLNL